MSCFRPNVLIPVLSAEKSQAPTYNIFNTFNKQWGTKCTVYLKSLETILYGFCCSLDDDNIKEEVEMVNPRSHHHAFCSTRHTLYQVTPLTWDNETVDLTINDEGNKYYCVLFLHVISL
jgi:hypothetical protein